MWLDKRFADAADFSLYFQCCCKSAFRNPHLFSQSLTNFVYRPLQKSEDVRPTPIAPIIAAHHGAPAKIEMARVMRRCCKMLTQDTMSNFADILRPSI